MLLLIPAERVAAMRAALHAAGRNEIGGQIFGEMLAPSNFRASGLTIQKQRGSFVRFLVDLAQAAREAMRFFERTGHHYTRFNYIGEWHSHPSFAVAPSGEDLETMREIVSDPNFRGTFSVLMIVRLDGGNLVGGAWLFSPQNRESPITVEFEE